MSASVVISTSGVGSVSGVSAYDHTQIAASISWLVNHNLGRVPIVEVRDTAGYSVDAEVQHLNVNQTRINLNVARAGTARFV